MDASFPQVSGELSIREIMAIHRENESCAACHDKLDPVGLIFENLDGIVRDAPSIDASGGLPDGTTLNGSREFSQALANRSDLSTCIAQKVMQFSLNRTMSLQERTLASNIGEVVFSNGEPMDALIKRIVRQDISVSYTHLTLPTTPYV